MANFGKALGAGLETLGAGLIKQGEFEGNMMYLTAAADKEYARKAGAATAKAQQEVYSNRYKENVSIHKELVKKWGDILAANGVVPPDLLDKITKSTENVSIAEADWFRSVGIKPTEVKPPNFTPFSIAFQQDAIIDQKHLKQIRKEMDKGKYTEIDDLLSRQKIFNAYSKSTQKLIRDQIIKDVKVLIIKDFKKDTAEPDPEDLPVSERGFFDSTGKEQVRRTAATVMGAPADVTTRILNMFPTAAEFIQEWWTGEGQDPAFQFSAAHPEADDTMRTPFGAEDFYRWYGGEGWFGGQGAEGMASPTGSTGPSGGPSAMGGRPRGMGSPESMAAQAAGASMAATALSASQPPVAAGANVPFESDPAAAAEARILAGQQAQAQGGGQQPSPQEATQQTLTEAPPDDVAAIKRFMQQLLQLIEQMGQAEAIQAMAKQFRGLSSSQKQILLADKQYGAAFKQLVR